MGKFVARQVVSLMKNKAKICCSKYIRALLFAATFFNPLQMLLLHDKLITEVKKGKNRPKLALATKQCCATS